MVSTTQDRLYIGGEWVAPIDGGVIESVDPANGQTWATAAFGGALDMDRAIDAAGDARKGKWKTMPVAERAGLLRRFAELYVREADTLSYVESRDTGRPIRDTKPEFPGHGQIWWWNASLADKLGGRTIPMDPSVHVYTTREPVGVVGAITAWNAPSFLANLKIAPALAAGCTVILKPSEITPVGAFYLARIAEEAGIPPGVFNVVPAYGNGGGSRLVEHRGVDKISFTGSGATAKKLLVLGAPTLKRFTFELGGKAPHIIFEDADIEMAINAATSSAWAVCGQSCALGSRVLVQRSIYTKVRDAFRDRAAMVRVGQPMDPQTHMGPQAHTAQLEKTMSYFDVARDEGATLVAGGERMIAGDLADGYYVKPTVYADVDNSMRIARDEIFGPVAALIPFDTEEEAVAIANDTDYGLTAGLWTRDLGRAHRVAAQIEAGSVWINTYRFIRFPIPYGGMKQSGWGRENGIEALDSYLETKATAVNLTGQFPNQYAS
ncbi:aldehyde dehydrogenase [Novosphingopyxis sp.]|uniref:aldehyde dehydrogenase n=1 Tax=Novosphingopyxis sp. TaxID=2709690 RepID=UPI003B590549